MPCKYLHEVSGKYPLAGLCHSPGSPKYRYEIDSEAFDSVCDSGFEECPFYRIGESRERRDLGRSRAT